MIYKKDGTAQGVAKQRLIETLAKPDERVINDPYADRFVLGARLMTLDPKSTNISNESAAKGIEQYVILGAGYDTRAHRLELPSSIKIFEVDQVEVQATKRSKLPKELTDLENITYVAVDFNRQSLTERLIDEGFDQSKSTIFTLEGVSQYITKEALNSTIKEVAKLTQKARSLFFLSYVNELLDKNPKACFGTGYPGAKKRASLIRYGSAKVGEPWISFYSTEDIESLLSKNDYTIIDNATLRDLNSRYFAPVGRTLSENQLFNFEHFVVAKSKN